MFHVAKPPLHRDVGHLDPLRDRTPGDLARGDSAE